MKVDYDLAQEPDCEEAVQRFFGMSREDRDEEYITPVEEVGGEPPRPSFLPSQSAAVGRSFPEPSHNGDAERIRRLEIAGQRMQDAMHSQTAMLRQMLDKMSERTPAMMPQSALKPGGRSRSAGPSEDHRRARSQEAAPSSHLGVQMSDRGLTGLTRNVSIFDDSSESDEEESSDDLL